MISIRREKAGDLPEIEKLLDLAFGPGRFAKSSYRLREGIDAIPALCFVGMIDGHMHGSIRYWPIRVGGAYDSLLLGPLAVDPSVRGQGLGVALVDHSLIAARAQGYNSVFLVGDEPYYARSGFEKTVPGRFTFPGPVDPTRLLMRTLDGQMPADFVGAIEKAPSAPLSAPGKKCND